MRHALVALAAVAFVALGSGTAGGGVDVGIADDAFKLDPAAAIAPARDLGARALRVTLGWTPGQTEPTAVEIARLRAAAETATGMRIVLSIFGANTSAPADAAGREAFCTYAANAVSSVPAIQDVIVWNEPNKQRFWKPQFNSDGSGASPPAYGALLARCYDALHAMAPGINVIGLATAPRGLDNPDGSGVISHAAATFIERLGDWYRASGRTAPLFDTVSHHPYPVTPKERPWRQHPGPYLGQGDWDKLMNALEAAFGGTGQPLPGQCVNGRCVEIWYTEAGVQTTVDDAKAGIYSGAETENRTVPDDAGGEPEAPPPPPTSDAPDQSTQLRDAFRLAFCQDYVGAYFNFLLYDELDLSRWQSGLYWADRTPKDSLSNITAAIAEVHGGVVDCTSLKGGGQPAADFTIAAATGDSLLAPSFVDTSTGSPTTWRWDTDGDGITDTTTPTASMTYPEPGLYEVRLLVRNGVGEGELTQTVAVSDVAPAAICETTDVHARTVEVWYGALDSPGGALREAAHTGSLMPAEVVARLSVEAPSPVVTQRASAWLSPLGSVDWLLSPEQAGTGQAALQAELESAALGEPGHVEHAEPVVSELAPMEVATWTASPAGRGLACHRGQVVFRFVEQASTLFPPPANAPPPGAGDAVAIIARSKLGPPRPGVVTIDVTVTCAGASGERCTGSVRASDRATGGYLARRAFSVGSGRTRTVPVRLSSRALRRRDATELVLSLRGTRGTVAEDAAWALSINDDEDSF